MGLYAKLHKTPKMHIKYMYFTSRRNCPQRLHIAFLLDDYQYVEFEFSILKDTITPSVASRIRSLFADFELDRNSTISYDDNFNANHPFYLYIMFLNQHMQFNIRKVSISSILARINAYHSYIRNKHATQITNRHMNTIWNKLVKYDKCNWISKDVDNGLAMISAQRAYWSKVCRLATYYLLIKEYLTKTVQKSQQKRLEKL